MITQYTGDDKSNQKQYAVLDEAKRGGIQVTRVTGRLTSDMVARVAAGFTQPVFYLSGSHAFVSSVNEMLRDLHVARRHIKCDYFPGIAG